MSSPSVGDDFAGYHLEAEIGRGGMSVVYRATERSMLGRTVALKVMAPFLAHDESFRARFLHEARTAAGLRHPGVIPIYAFDTWDDELYLAMQLVEGTDLHRHIRERGVLSLPEAVSVVGQAADALDAVHARGVTHRDIKPANLLLDHSVSSAGAHVYVVDFGLARAADGKSFTGTGQVLGTLSYAAPEQVRGDPVDARTDVYALGCVLYEALTGARPFEQESDVALMYAHLEAERPAASSRRPDLGPEVDEVIRVAMARDPEHRWQSCGDMVRALASSSSGPTVVRTVPLGGVPGAAAAGVAAAGVAGPATPAPGTAPAPPPSPTPPGPAAPVAPIPPPAAAYVPAAAGAPVDPYGPTGGAPGGPLPGGAGYGGPPPSIPPGASPTRVSPATRRRQVMGLVGLVGVALVVAVLLGVALVLTRPSGTDTATAPTAGGTLAPAGGPSTTAAPPTTATTATTAPTSAAPTVTAAPATPATPAPTAAPTTTTTRAPSTTAATTAVGPPLPAYGPAGTWRVVETAPLHAGTTSETTVLTFVPGGTFLPVYCAADGQYVDPGQYVGTSDWNLVTYQGTTGYVPDYYMATGVGSESAIGDGTIPRC